MLGKGRRPRPGALSYHDKNDTPQAKAQSETARMTRVVVLRSGQAAWGRFK